MEGFRCPGNRKEKEKLRLMDHNTLAQLQALPLSAKVWRTKCKIREWYNHHGGNVYCAFSGGKDSTVLLHIIRKVCGYKNIPAVFCDTGLEYPEIRAFVKETENTVWLKPKMSFKAVLNKYGFPVVSKEVSQKIYEVRTTKSDKLRYKRLYGDSNKYKSGKIPEKWKPLIDSKFKISHKCCDVMKKRPDKTYQKESKLLPITGIMAADSHARRQKYLRAGGCNSYEGKIESMPMSIWTEQNVWDYINQNNVSYCKIYNMGYTRTGCVFCMFGVHMEKGINRFQLMKQTHPKLWNYCINKLGIGEILDYIGVKYA